MTWQHHWWEHTAIVWTCPLFIGAATLRDWMVLIGTIKPYGLNTKSVDFAPKYQPPFKKILPFVVPFSKTANLAAKIIKKTLQKIKKLWWILCFDFDVITAYSRHKNVSDYLVHSKLCWIITHRYPWRIVSWCCCKYINFCTTSKK